MADIKPAAFNMSHTLKRIHAIWQESLDGLCAADYADKLPNIDVPCPFFKMLIINQRAECVYGISFRFDPTGRHCIEVPFVEMEVCCDSRFHDIVVGHKSTCSWYVTPKDQHGVLEPDVQDTESI